MASSPADRGPARRRLRPPRPQPHRGPGPVQRPGCSANGSNVASAGRARPVRGAPAPARRRGRDRGPADGSAHAPAVWPPVRDGHRHRQRLGCALASGRCPAVLSDRAVDRPRDALDAKRPSTGHDREHSLGMQDHRPLRAPFPGRLGELSRASRGGSVRQDCSFVRSHALSSSRTTPIEGPGRFEDRGAQ